MSPRSNACERERERERERKEREKRERERERKEREKREREEREREKKNRERGAKEVCGNLSPDQKEEEKKLPPSTKLPEGFERLSPSSLKGKLDVLFSWREGGKGMQGRGGKMRECGRE